MVSVILSTMLGASVGATVTTLLSSKSGSERRQAFKKEMNELTTDINDVTSSIQQVKDSLAHLMATVQTIVPETKEEIETLTTEAKFQLEPRITRVNQAISQLKTDLEDTDHTKK